MQFGIIKDKQIFQRLTKLHEPAGRVQFVVFEKFTSAYLFQFALEKSRDYLLIIYITCKHFTLFSVNLFYFVSQLTGPAYINIIGWKMTTFIDMPALMETYRPNLFSQILEAAIILNTKAFSFGKPEKEKRCEIMSKLNLSCSLSIVNRGN